MKRDITLARVNELRTAMGTLQTIYESLDDRMFTTIEEAAEAAQRNLIDPDVEIEREYLSIVHDYVVIYDEIASIRAAWFVR